MSPLICHCDKNDPLFCHLANFMKFKNIFLRIKVVEVCFLSFCQAKTLGCDVVSNQGRNLGLLVNSARTSGLTSIQGDLGESGKGIFVSQSN